MRFNPLRYSSWIDFLVRAERFFRERITKRLGRQSETRGEVRERRREREIMIAQKLRNDAHRKLDLAHTRGSPEIEREAVAMLRMADNIARGGEGQLLYAMFLLGTNGDGGDG